MIRHEKVARSMHRDLDNFVSLVLRAVHYHPFPRSAYILPLPGSRIVNILGLPIPALKTGWLPILVVLVVRRSSQYFRQSSALPGSGGVKTFGRSLPASGFRLPLPILVVLVVRPSSQQLQQSSALLGPGAAKTFGRSLPASEFWCLF